MQIIMCFFFKSVKTAGEIRTLLLQGFSPTESNEEGRDLVWQK